MAYRHLIFLGISLLNQSLFSQTKQYVHQQIVKERNYHLNNGLRTFVGGKSRTTIKVDLPPNTVAWYYAFTTTKDETGSDLLNLAVQIGTLLLDESGTLAKIKSQIRIPGGTGVLEVYLLDVKNSDLFLNHDEYNYYREGSVDQIRDGIIDIDEFKTGTFYIGLKNPSEIDGIDVRIEVVAIVEEQIQNNSTISSNNNNSYSTTTNIGNDKPTIDDLKKEISYQLLFQQYGAAAEKYIQLVELERTATNYNSIGWCLLLNKQFSRAIKYLSDGIALDNYNLYLQGNIAHAYLLTDDFDKAKEIYLKYKYEKLNSSMTWIEMVKGDFKTFEKRGINSSNFQTILNLLNNEGASQSSNAGAVDSILVVSDSYLLKGEYDNAIQVLEGEITKHWSNKENLKLLYFRIGAAYSKKGEKLLQNGDKTDYKQIYETAVNYYNKTLEIDAGYHAAYNGIANYYITTGNEFLLAADQVPLDKQNEYNDLKTKAIDEYKKAIGYLEQAYKLDKQFAYKNLLNQLYEKTSQKTRIK
jgi:tetratricopeptide (TPR) repeat protein